MLYIANLYQLICSFVSLIQRTVKKGITSKVLRKMLVTFMTLAFFYLVIGDLILIHQKAIFHYDAFAGQPLSKPDKSGKQSLYKLKDKKDRVYINYLTFISGIIEFQECQTFISGIVCVGYCLSQKIKDYHYSTISLRGPPVFS